MDRKAFIDGLGPVLMNLGYRKKGNYWYKNGTDLVYCVNVQGSQWSKDGYYVNVGISRTNIEGSTPTLLQWDYRHRCKGEQGEINISPKEVLDILEEIMHSVSSSSEIDSFLYGRKYKKIGTQYWF